MAEAAQKLLVESCKGLLVSGDYSDLTITCHSDTYKVHKNVVCSRSKFFANAINFGGKESESNTVSLPEDDPTTVKLLVQYLYEGDYHPSALPFVAQNSEVSTNSVSQHSSKNKSGKMPRNVQPSDSPHWCTYSGCSYIVCDHHQCGHNCGYDCYSFVCQNCNPTPPLPPIEGQADQLSTHATLYALGDRYGVVGLRELAQEKFRRACLHFWDSPEFAVAVHLAFSTTMDEDKGLRDIVSKTVADHMDLVNKPEVEVLMKQFNGLAFGLLRQKVAQGWR